MSTKLLESFSSKLAEQWVASFLTPAFVFWTGGAAVGLQRFGWTSISIWFKQQPEPLQISLLASILCLIVTSAFVAQRFDLPVLRFLEGYWHPWLRPLRRWIIEREITYSRKLNLQYKSIDRELKISQLTVDQEREFQTLLELKLNEENRDRFRELKKLIQHRANQQSKLAQIDWQQMHRPLLNQLMPTRLGNILRAAEQRPLEKYGLDVIICWSRLWLLLPDAVKKDIQEARTDLNVAARVWLWSLLFCFWAILPEQTLGLLALWPLMLGLLSATFSYYYWALVAARTYGELIEATFDLYRHLLYQSLRWGLPADPNEERRVGQQLTEYLWRGF